MTYETDRRAQAVHDGSRCMGEVCSASHDPAAGGGNGQGRTPAEAAAHVLSILRAPIPRQPQGRTAPQPPSHDWKLGPLKHREPVWSPPYHTRLIR